jgi:hypothetical protein
MSLIKFYPEDTSKINTANLVTVNPDPQIQKIVFTSGSVLWKIQRIWKIDESLHADDGAERDMEHTLLPKSCLLSSIIVDSELDGRYYNVAFAHLTKEETAADVKASAMKGPDYELDEP